MVETRSARARRRAAFGAALVLAFLGVAFLVWSISQHQDARDDLADARAHLATRRDATSSDLQHLRDAQDAVASVHDQLAALVAPAAGTTGLADLDQKDLEAVRTAIEAGLAGKLADYNTAVDQRTALDPQHDTALEQLRQQANAVITALASLT